MEIVGAAVYVHLDVEVLFFIVLPDAKLSLFLFEVFDGVVL